MPRVQKSPRPCSRGRPVIHDLCARHNRRQPADDRQLARSRFPSGRFPQVNPERNHHGAGLPVRAAAAADLTWLERDCPLAGEAGVKHDVIVALDALAWDEIQQSGRGGLRHLPLRNGRTTVHQPRPICRNRIRLQARALPPPHQCGSRRSRTRGARGFRIGRPAAAPATTVGSGRCGSPSAGRRGVSILTPPALPFAEGSGNARVVTAAGVRQQ
jgi:hypothetical protein